MGASVVRIDRDAIETAVNMAMQKYAMWKQQAKAE